MNKGTPQKSHHLSINFPAFTIRVAFALCLYIHICSCTGAMLCFTFLLFIIKHIHVGGIFASIKSALTENCIHLNISVECGECHVCVVVHEKYALDERVRA